MKKIISLFSLIAVLLIIGLVGDWETKYNIDATCIKLDAGTAQFCDVRGHVWEWELDKNDFIQVNKNYILHMDNNHTSSILDDKIRNFSKK